MKHLQLSLIFTYFLALALSTFAQAQPWDFVREKDGIKLYTRTEPGKHVKSFKGVTDIGAPVERVFDVLRDISDIEWWDKNVSLNKVLYYEKNTGGRYYLVYNLPWPVTDRDLCVDISVSNPKVSGERKISAVSVNSVIPERKDMVRIKDYKQVWTIRPEGINTHVELEGRVDPAGNIPEKIINMLIIESPYKSISGLTKHLIRND